MGLTFGTPSNDVTILTEGTDFYAWPCINGERFPPVFGGSAGLAGYGSDGPNPTVKFYNAGTPNATWPNLPRVGPAHDQIERVRISFRVRGINGLSSGSSFWQIQLFNSYPLIFRMEKDPAVAFSIRAYLSTEFGPGIYVPGFTTWADIEIVIESNGDVTWSANGTTIETVNVGSGTDNTTIRPYVSANLSFGLGPEQFHLSNLRVQWEKP